MHWTAFLAYRRFPAHARIVDDCACIQCGYNLRMQMVAARCPECGYEVGHSVFLLAHPAVTARGLRTAGVTYLAPFMMILPMVTSAYWAIFIVSLAAATAALFRFIGVSDLRINAAMARLPVVGQRLNAWWAWTMVDLSISSAWMIGLIVVSQSRILQNNGTGTALIVGGSLAWWASMLISAMIAGRFGFALMDMLNYTWTRIEFRVQQIACVTMLLLAPFLVLGMRSASSATFRAVLAGTLVVLTLLLMLATALALRHSATAAEESAESWDDLIDEARIAMVPESQRPRQPEPPAIRVEGG
jgi:hypothetical protein